MISIFELDKNKSGQFIWRIKAANGEVTAHGESHTTKRNGKRFYQALQDLILNGRPDKIKFKDLTVKKKGGHNQNHIKRRAKRKLADD